MSKFREVARRPRVRAGVVAVCVAVGVGALLVSLQMVRDQGRAEVAAMLPETTGAVVPDTDRPATVTPVAEPTPQWVSIPAQPAATGISPGAPMTVTRADGSTITCTIGPAVYQSGTRRAGFLVAGGCAGRASAGGVVLGEVTEVVDTFAEGSGELGDEVELVAEDAGIIWTDLAGGQRIVAGHRVVDVMPEAELRELPEGTPICRAGGVSGVTCGEFMFSRFFLATSFGTDFGDPGDAGAPMFVVGADGNAHLVAIRGSGQSAAGSIAERTMRRLGLMEMH